MIKKWFKPLQRPPTELTAKQPTLADMAPSCWVNSIEDIRNGSRLAYRSMASSPLVFWLGTSLVVPTPILSNLQFRQFWQPNQFRQFCRAYQFRQFCRTNQPSQFWRPTRLCQIYHPIFRHFWQTHIQPRQIHQLRRQHQRSADLSITTTTIFPNIALSVTSLLSDPWILSYKKFTADAAVTMVLQQHGENTLSQRQNFHPSSAWLCSALPFVSENPEHRS